MFVAASTDCFPNLPLLACLDRLADLEYTRVELVIREDSQALKPSEVAADFERALRLCKEGHRLTPVAFSVDIQATGDEYFKQFEAICRLAKALKVVCVTVPPAELGSPFNSEIERLRELVKIASVDGVVVSLKTQHGCLTQNPDTAMSLCNTVKGLGITLDPSHYVFGTTSPVRYDHLLKLVCHVQLRDSTPQALQVRVGQGEIEYGKLITDLNKVRYNRALSVNIDEMPEVDHGVEMRKMRLLLESLLD